MEDVRIAGEEKDGSQSAFDQAEAVAAPVFGGTGALSRHWTSHPPLDVLAAVSRPILPGRELIGEEKCRRLHDLSALAGGRKQVPPITVEMSPREV